MCHKDCFFTGTQEHSQTRQSAAMKRLCLKITITKGASWSVFQDKENDYGYLLNKANKTSLCNHRHQNIAILIYKAFNNITPSYIQDLFNTRNTNY